MKKIRSSSLLIGSVIANELQTNITTYPIVAPIDTKYPFAVYKRLGLEFANTKDMYNVEEIATVEIVIVAQSYAESLRYATDIKMFIERLKGKYKTMKNEEINIEDITVIDASEEWNNDAYLQKMTVQIIINNQPEY